MLANGGTNRGATMGVKRTSLIAIFALLMATASRASDDPQLSTCEPITAAVLHPPRSQDADLFSIMQRLVEIESDTVPCYEAATLNVARCAFSAHSGQNAWLEDAAGRRFAVAGRRIDRDDDPNGEYFVATYAALKVPCIAATGYDRSSTSTSNEFGGTCIVETAGSAQNKAGPLVNYARLPVCTSSNPHPDGAQLVSSDPARGVYCYQGKGAGLNDPQGRERDQSGAYLSGNRYCHVVWNSGLEVPAAKRPATTSGWPVKVNEKSPIVWRAYTSSVRIAN